MISYLVPGPERIFALGTETVRRSPAQARFAQLRKSIDIMNVLLVIIKTHLFLVIYSSIIFRFNHMDFNQLLAIQMDVKLRKRNNNNRFLKKVLNTESKITFSDSAFHKPADMISELGRFALNFKVAYNNR